MAIVLVAVCLSVCKKITFESLDIFGLQGYLRGIQVKLIYEGHRVKVKVTAAKKHIIPYSHNVILQCLDSHEVCVQRGVFAMAD